jgi:iron uptake system component EfeO
MRFSLPAIGLGLAATAACSGGGGSAPSYDVKAGDSSCQVSRTDLPAGKATFKVTNAGSQVTEVYVYAREGGEFTKVVGEKENIGPGTSQSFTVDLSAGTYEVACKPGMKGDGIRTKVTVAGG